MRFLSLNTRFVGNRYQIALRQSWPSSDHNRGQDLAEPPVNTTRLLAGNRILARSFRMRFQGRVPSRRESLICRLGVTNLVQCRIAAKCQYPPEFGWDPTRSWTRSARAGWAKFTAQKIRGTTRRCADDSGWRWFSLRAQNAVKILPAHLSSDPV